MGKFWFRYWFQVILFMAVLGVGMMLYFVIPLLNKDEKLPKQQEYSESSFLIFAEHEACVTGYNLLKDKEIPATLYDQLILYKKEHPSLTPLINKSMADNKITFSEYCSFVSHINKEKEREDIKYTEKIKKRLMEEVHEQSMAEKDKKEGKSMKPMSVVRYNS